MNKNFRHGLQFNGIHAYGIFPKINFEKNDSWRITIHFLEEKNDRLFNFYFGKRKGSTHAFVRVKDKIYFRVDNGLYIGGLEYSQGTFFMLQVSYHKGSWYFTDKKNKNLKLPLHVY